jgi:protein-L-isoaspartate(D-aspartate) O-methyltransferase
MIRIQEDTYRHKGLRAKLIEEIKGKGISDDQVLKAMDAIPRHFFLDPAFDNIAYEDRAFPIGEGQTISHPYTVAYQTQLLQVNRLEKVLEIGTGSGFQTCILCKLGVRVYTIERHHDLHDKARRMLTFLNLNARMNFGDGYKGMPSHAPFDKILVTCGAPEIPEELLKQLKIGGLMVIPVGEGKEQKMLRIKKIAEDDVDIEEFGTFKFVPMLERTVK